MAATRYDLAIKQGSDVDFTVQVWADSAHTVVQVITGWTAKMQIKSSKDSGNITYETLPGANGSLTINGPAGQVTVHITGAATGAYTWITGEYDLYIYGPANVPAKCVLEGNVTVNDRITV